MVWTTKHQPNTQRFPSAALARSLRCTHMWHLFDSLAAGSLHSAAVIAIKGSEPSAVLYTW